MCHVSSGIMHSLTVATTCEQAFEFSVNFLLLNERPILMIMNVASLLSLKVTERELRAIIRDYLTPDEVKEVITVAGLMLNTRQYGGEAMRVARVAD